ncbi:Ig-like domain-containing protein [Brevibacillus parabrevis]|uniref:Ig-like domain-containing protein n=1 Tax=Brevibacillus parabrevis TaxID=54914 RepID=UPI0028D3CCEE|nr:Ig-like domain-containing protein [Brevibacillus parabrevis]
MNKKVVLSVLATAVVASMAASAFAAPKTGLYIGGNVKKFYSNDTLINMTKDARATYKNELKTIGFKNLVYVNFKGQGATIQEMIDLGVKVAMADPLKQSDFSDLYSVVNNDGTISGTEDARSKVDPTTPGELKVESVSAINGKTVEIKFATAVDEDSVVTGAGILQNITFTKLTGAATVTAGTLAAELSEDGKTLTVTPGAAEFFKGDYAVEVTTGVKDANGKALAAKYNTLLSVNDTTAPTIVSATASAKTTTTKVTLKFSEPVVDTSAVVKINGVAGFVAYGADQSELEVTTSTQLQAGQTYSVQVLNLKDFAGNLLPNFTSNVTVTADATAPTVTNLNVVRDNLIEVTFDKAISLASLQATGAVKLLDGNSTDLAGGNITGITAKANTGGKTFRIALDNTPALPFVNGSFSGTLVFTDSVTDTAGNKIAPTNKPFTLTMDTAVPTVASLTFKKANATGTYAGVALTNGAIVVKFSEAVTKDAAMATAAANWKLISNAGADVTTTYLTNTELAAAAVNTDDPTEVVIPLKTKITTASGITSFTVRMPAGQVDDLSLSANTNAASVNNVAVEADEVPASDTAVPTIAWGSVGGNATTGNTFSLTVSDNVDVDKATLLDLNNYRLDGAPLPAGTYITITGAASPYTVTVNLPVDAITADKDFALTVSGFKDKAGNTAVTFTKNNVALKDYVAPELTAAALNTDGTLSLTFSEAVNTGVGKEADFALKVNGSTAFNTGANKAFTIADGVGAEAGKYVVSVQKSVYGIAATVGSVAVNGQTHTTANPTDVVKFTFIDVDGSQTYNTGDILISAVDTGSTTAVPFAADGNYNLNSASALKIATIVSPSLVKDTSGATNVVKGNKEITVK